MKSLERRIQKIEERVPQLLCPNPEQGRAGIFMYGVTPEQNRENDDEIIESIHNCEYCKARETNGEPLIMILRTLAQSDDL